MQPILKRKTPTTLTADRLFNFVAANLKSTGSSTLKERKESISSEKILSIKKKINDLHKISKNKNVRPICKKYEQLVTELDSIKKELEQPINSE